MPTAVLRRAPVETIVTTIIDSPVGPLLAAATDKGLCLLEFARPRTESQLAQVEGQFKTVAKPGRHPVLEQARKQLAEYFSGKRRTFSVPMSCRGTPFQKKVWHQLCRIPFGETQSYAEVARAVGTPNGFRAVGRANGQNPICIVVPCHRVVNADGQLGGYGGGLNRKSFLLKLEQRSA